MRLLHVFHAVGFVSIASTCIAALNLTPGSLLVSSSTNGILREVNPVTGVVSSSIQVRAVNGAIFSSLLAVSIIDDEVYVIGNDGVGRVNKATGTFTPLFQYFGDGLGNLNGNMITQGGGFDVDTWSTNGLLLGVTLLDLDHAGISDVSWRLRDVASTGTNYTLLYETESDAINFFTFYNFRFDGSYITQETNYIRPSLYLAQGFDIDPANNNRWVALRRWDDFNSQLRLYEENNVNAIRTFTVNFGAVSDVAIVPVPSPATLSVPIACALFSVRRRR